MKNITGNIESIRAVEDCIRATRKYSEGFFTKQRKHPIQGKDFPSRVFTKCYEVYPHKEIPTWDDTPGKVLDWFSTPPIVVEFYYDYRIDKATMCVRHRELSILMKTIPNLNEVINSIAPYIYREVIDVRVLQVSEVQKRATNTQKF